MDIPPKVEPIVLQRNQLETAALSVATMRGASWSAIRLLLRPSSGIELSAIAATACLIEEEMLQPAGEATFEPPQCTTPLPHRCAARTPSIRHQPLARVKLEAHPAPRAKLEALPETAQLLGRLSARACARLGHSHWLATPARRGWGASGAQQWSPSSPHKSSCAGRWPPRAQATTQPPEQGVQAVVVRLPPRAPLHFSAGTTGGG